MRLHHLLYQPRILPFNGFYSEFFFILLCLNDDQKVNLTQSMKENVKDYFKIKGHLKHILLI